MEAEGSRNNVRSRIKDHRLSNSSALSNTVTSEAGLSHTVPPFAAFRKAAWSVFNREALE